MARRGPRSYASMSFSNIRFFLPARQSHTRHNIFPYAQVGVHKHGSTAAVQCSKMCGADMQQVATPPAHHAWSVPFVEVAPNKLVLAYLIINCPGHRVRIGMADGYGKRISSIVGLCSWSRRSSSAPGLHLLFLPAVAATACLTCMAYTRRCRRQSAARSHTPRPAPAPRRWLDIAAKEQFSRLT